MAHVSAMFTTANMYILLDEDATRVLIKPLPSWQTLFLLQGVPRTGQTLPAGMLAE